MAAWVPGAPLSLLGWSPTCLYHFSMCGSLLALGLMDRCIPSPGTFSSELASNRVQWQLGSVGSESLNYRPAKVSKHKIEQNQQRENLCSVPKLRFPFRESFLDIVLSTVSVLHPSQAQNLMMPFHPRSLGNFQSFMNTTLISSDSSLPSLSSQSPQTWPDRILSCLLS